MNKNLEMRLKFFETAKGQKTPFDFYQKGFCF